MCFPGDLVTRLRWVLARDVQVGFRQFLLLCLPGVVLGLILRLHFLWVTPEGYFGADSASYYEFTHELFTEGEFTLSAKRRWLYPVFLALASATPVPAWYVVPVVQHLVGLATVVGIGWVALQLSRRPRLVVPLVVLVSASWPRMLWYEHEFIAESLLLAGFVFTVALALTPGIFRSRRGLFALFLAMAVMAGMKGAGRFLWLGTVLGILLLAGNPRRWAWTWRSGISAVLAAVLALTVGKSAQGNWLLLNSVLPLVRETGEPYGRYRQALRPLIGEARRHGDAYPWEAKYFKKRLNSKDPQVVHPAWAELNRDDKEFSRVSRSLAFDAIRRHPVEFTRFTLLTGGIAMTEGIVNGRMAPRKFWQEQWNNTKNRWVENPSYPRMVFRVDGAGFHRRAIRGRTGRYAFLPFLTGVERQLQWMRRQPPGPDGPALALTPAGGLVGLGAVVSLLRPTRRRALVLLLPAALYTFGVFAVGDAVSRYLLPVEWIGIILGVLAIEAGVDLLAWLGSRRPVPVSAP